MQRIIEIKGAEGGKDAKLFAHDLANAYVRLADRKTWKATSTVISDGHIEIHITGKKLQGLDQEAGGHRIQRVPPTEKRGRVHTSSVTVSVIDPEIQTDPNLSLIDDQHFRVEWFSGTGAGGQHRNKKQNSCRLIHTPTGLVETRQGRKRASNLREAKEALIKRLEGARLSCLYSTTSVVRKEQVGSGMRGDKIRTYRFQDDRVVDHQSGKKASCSKVLKGWFEKLWR